MLLIDLILGLVSNQGDYMCTLLSAHLEEDKEVYLEITQVFELYDLNLKLTLTFFLQKFDIIWSKN